MDAHDTNLPLNQGELEEEKKQLKFQFLQRKRQLKKQLPKFNLHPLPDQPTRRKHWPG